MKKLVLAVLAIIVMAGLGFAQGAEMKVKLGLETQNSVINQWNNVTGTNNGIAAAAEILFSAGDTVKIGPGFGVSFSRDAKFPDYEKAYGISESISMIPIYVTMEINPIKAAPGVFFKGNIGCVIATVSETNPYNLLIGPTDTISSHYGGIYYGLGAGYEFPFGLFFDALYNWNTLFVDSVVGTYGKLTISAGYKFNL